MSVRRLAPPDVQPPSFSFTPETQAQVDWWIAKFPAGRQQSASIPVLWLVQKQEGWISEPAVRAVAELLAMPVIRLLAGAPFYPMCMRAPVGPAALVQVCGTTPCMLRGSGELMEVCREAIGPKDHISRDGLFTWQEVECLGACCHAPMAQINDRYSEDLTPDALRHILDEFRAGRTPPPGSAVGRRSAEPQGAPLTLSDPALYDGSRAQPLVIPNLPQPEPA